VHVELKWWKKIVGIYEINKIVRDRDFMRTPLKLRFEFLF
jgi:hypothetical protein